MSEPQDESAERDALLMEAATSLTAAGGYTDMDRYRDFRLVFQGSEEGKRVFRELLAWGHMFRTSMTGAPVDPLRLAFREGERNIALRLLNAISTEPKAKPDRANSQPSKG